MHNPLERLQQAVRQMIEISDDEMQAFLAGCQVRHCARRTFLSEPGKAAQEVFFISRGLIRVAITDREGAEHTIHFAQEDQFVCDYASFLQQTPSVYRVQAVEATEVVALPRPLIEWGYAHLRQGDRLGRLVAESYFVYHDARIKTMYTQTVNERYAQLTHTFADLHNRAPQWMIASYLGVSAVHLSRIKKAVRQKI